MHTDFGKETKYRSCHASINTNISVGIGTTDIWIVRPLSSYALIVKTISDLTVAHSMQATKLGEAYGGNARKHNC